MFCMFHPSSPLPRTPRRQRDDLEISKTRSCILIALLLEEQREKAVVQDAGAVTMVRANCRREELLLKIPPKSETGRGRKGEKERNNDGRVGAGRETDPVFSQSFPSLFSQICFPAVFLFSSLLSVSPTGQT